MGYMITMQFDEVKVPYGLVGAAIDGLAAVRKQNTSWSHTSNEYVDSLEGLITEWGFGIKLRKDGVYITVFHDEKWSDDYEIFFNALAPYVAEDALIIVSPDGEDGQPWRYVFHDKHIVLEHAALTWRPGPRP